MSRPSRAVQGTLALGLAVLLGRACPGPAPPPGDAHQVLQSLIDAAGPGALVEFPDGVFLLCDSLKPLPGQTWDLHGTTLRRCPAIVSNLLEDAPAGATSVRVGEPSVFEIGQRITPVKSPDHDGGEAGPPRHVVNGIVGDTVYFSNPLGQAYSAGDLFLVIDPMIESDEADGWTLRGGLIDGNRRANPYFVAWEVAWSVSAVGRDILIEDVSFVDCWGDCLKAQRLVDSTIRNVTFSGGSTSGIHLGSVENLQIESSVFEFLNRDALAGGHSQGAITWSAANRGVEISRVCMADISDQAEGALANTNFYWNKEIEIHDSVFCRVPALWRGWIAVAALPEFDPPGFVDIEGNLAVDAGHSTVDVYGGLAVVGIEFHDNTLVNATYDWSATVDPVVEGNVTLAPPFACSCEGWLD